VQKLTGKDLVRAVDDPNDKRRFQLHLTPKGERLMPKLLGIADVVRGAIERGISGTEKAALLTTLRKVVDNLDPARTGDGPKRNDLRLAGTSGSSLRKQGRR
jgi:DNA-binding MarR family transcriptional regulator